MDIDSFNQVQKQLLDLLTKYTSLNEGKIFYGDWTIKEVVSHISAWDLYFASVLEALFNSKEIDYWGDINSFNTRAILTRRNKTLEELKSELKKAGDKFIKSYLSLNENLLAKKIWKDKKYTPNDLLKIELSHYTSQIKQISKRL
jgi:hypothetical protein